MFGAYFNTILICIFISQVSSQDNNIYACDSPIYCKGSLLKAAQNAYIYNDSKSFVDMKMKENQSFILSAFDVLMQDNNGNPTDDMVKEFVRNYFDEPGSEFAEWKPSDWVESPEFLKEVSDIDLSEWLRHLNSLWKVL